MNSRASTSSRNSKAQSTSSSTNSSTEENCFAVKRDFALAGNSASNEQDSLKISGDDVCHERTVKQALESDDEREEVVMSAIWCSGKLGTAYYETGSTQLSMQMDILETQDFQFLKQLIRQVNPTVIVTSSNQDERFLKILQGQENENSAEISASNIELEILPSVDFSLDICKRRILSLNGLPGIPQHYTDEERMLYLGSVVPFENINMVKATGALIKYLEKKRVGVELEDSDTKVPILSLKTYSLDHTKESRSNDQTNLIGTAIRILKQIYADFTDDDFRSNQEDSMIIDENTYSALQIFQKESHPSVYKVGSGTKEGLSLFGMMNMTKSVIGHRLLRVWFLRPTTNIQVLKERQKAVAFFHSPRNLEVVLSIQDSLKHVKCISRVLLKMASAQASTNDWQSLYKTVYNAIYIANICKTLLDIEIAQKITREFSEDLHRVASLIDKIVDFDDSVAQNRFVVKPGVDESLDEKKRTYNGLPDFMTKVAQEELSRLDASILECNILYLPQLGYLLAIPRTEQMKEEKDFEMEGLQFVFFSDNTVHYKSASTRELDILLGDTLCEITDHETAIMHRLQSIILEHTNLLMKVMEYTAELDCLIALSVHAKEYNYVCPELTEENILDIKGGRHPLQEMYVTPFVANDTLVEKEALRMKILTGPNASGKSVYLKQVGLIVYLAHIGSYVPAESAIIGITDRIFTRIHTRESVSVGLSTFMIDLNQVACAVRFASERSLIIIDEFGKGTATVDGLSLLTACLKHWLSEGNRCPKVLVSTHFHSIIQHKLLPLTPLVRFQTMETMQNNDELVFLYQLIDGYTNTSYACHIASLAGISSDLVKRGHEILDLIRSNKPIKRRDSIENKNELTRCSNIVQTFLNLDLEQHDLALFLKSTSRCESKSEEN